MVERAGVDVEQLPGPSGHYMRRGKTSPFDSKFLK
jgi:hypothetical protein